MFDIIVRGGDVIDGSGSPRYRADVGIRGERIAAIGRLDSSRAQRVIDASGRVVCPGFIDVHTHSDVLLLAHPRHEPKIFQGVTTDLLGLDGLSYAPLSPANLLMMRRFLSGLNGEPDIDWSWSSVSEYLARFHRQVAVNVAYLVPHNALRLETVGFADRPPDAAELAGMQALLAQGMEEGAVGFSTGLDYYPCRYAGREGLIGICRTVAEHDGVSVWHVRKLELGLLESIREVLRIAAETGVRTHFSHYAVPDASRRGESEEMLAMVDRARESGLDVTFDSYPYIAQSTALIVFLPRWVNDGGPDAILERLAQPETRRKICADLRSRSIDWSHRILTAVPSRKNSIYVGKSLLEAAAMAGSEPAEFFCDLLLEEKLAVGFLTRLGVEEDVRRIMRHPCHIAGSDGILVGEKPNPRGWGTFPRYLGLYARDLGVLELEEAVRHMTSSPAARFGLYDRGLIREGLAADIVVFDPRTVIDNATFDRPKEYPSGIDFVLVNGALAVTQGEHTGALNGRALRKK